LTVIHMVIMSRHVDFFSFTFILNLSLTLTQMLCKSGRLVTSTLLVHVRSKSGGICDMSPWGVGAAALLLSWDEQSDREANESSR